ncbi:MULTISPECIES: restriction endonuclease [unclassified Corallococcus]|uniref:restriction endonuclease n=1 Tax=unclassified Corallococcus TaxID=2685029 RepID=UPI001A8CFE8A|nr:MULTISPECIES: restriction endonuclease [unclassified Corallococcus]MBN9685914.1 restriction endonuclease [Corallococcus sp. NCSPR001]WAS82646.1 restriction endonuclease [Corallococcus sp. NCRR]
MANIRPVDFILLDSIFEMNTGYVLDFSDRTMSRFFSDELNIDIDNPVYQDDGNSKAKRLRCFLRKVDAPTAVRTLNALWEYREARRQQACREEIVANAHGRLLELINRLQGGPRREQAPAAPAFNREKAAQLRAALMALANLNPHPRGYAFERFLKDLFDAYGLAARDAFRLQGEQIDGSFLLGSEVYLLEAKWHGASIGNAELHAFHGKVEQKAAWTRGLFISHSGFTEDGLHAFGRGKRVICMDGLDLWDALSREIPMNHVLEQKVRHAAEKGEPFARVRDLFPN